ncbi:DUF1906 domain-containing protein [Alkalibaculum sp. M08DMB]|uniref:DUF1906 domain-containing protein n=1 Tax=Alkalibaculum sporogenes TaxID=2655001 RepID=A0A6A7K8V9_9FIRM|nr:glycoside hydrolase domain-containing protein [Alkalibaculum sporogenes]MPW25795.1 DUF1906 domain-containing protein [Alkalibaculum sporogenes]
MDIMVYAAQAWLNLTYRGRIGYNEIPEDGITGWATMYALTRALQIELGIAVTSDNFGSQTMAACPTLSVNSIPEDITDSNIVRILQSAMYCKGYSPGDISGNYTVATKDGIQQMQSHAGLSNTDGVATPLIFKALLTMDAYVLLPGGDSNIRTIQRNLNRDYYPAIGGLIPCDGIYGRNTCKAMIMSLQIKGGVAVDGLWGPSTVATLPVLVYGNSNRDYNYLLQYALYANGFSPNGFDGLFGNGCRTAVQNFQEFCMITVDGIVGARTWASLMVSAGDTSRSATACDCSTTVTAPRAATIYNNGYRIVGRYLTGGWKEIQPGEIQTIFNADLKIFPIYQTSGDSAGYFNYSRGGVDAVKAIVAAKKNGFKPDTTIYFAVDFDALDHHVTNNILPYFRGIYNQFTSSNPGYKIGIYGPRNVCSRIGGAGYSTSSFVSDMSTGFSGNLGYKLPNDWNFDQILEYSIGSGEGQIAIDKNICRGNYMGESSVIESSGVTTSDIVALANNLDGIMNRLGITFTSPEAEIVLINTPLVKISANFSVSSVFSEGDGLLVKVENGQIVSAEGEVFDVTGAFDIDGATLGAKIASWEGIDFSVSMTTTPTGTKIRLINQYNAEYFDQIGYLTEQLTIEFKSLNEILLETQISAAFDDILEWVDENSGLILGICIVAVVIAIIGLLGIGISTIAAAIASFASALMTYGMIIVFLMFFTNKIFEEDIT